MSENLIFDPQLRFNNEIFSVVPNTIRYTTGNGESSVKPQSSGNGQVTMVYSENVETKIARLVVSVYATPEKLKKIKELKKARANNYVAINATNINEVIVEAAIVNDPEFTLGNDGQAEIEIAGKPAE